MSLAPSRSTDLPAVLARYGWSSVACGKYRRGSLECWTLGLSVRLYPGPLDPDGPRECVAFRDFIVSEWLDPEFVGRVVESLASSVEAAS